ncbi:S66 peptidase family protein [Nonomuraea sp. NPDC050643]|uniref:S66 peptidase family protein n=1 Tax=Nonomuraea sp. NPDC050643 TaxID=3155660 RepID=UPI0033E18B0B
MRADVLIRPAGLPDRATVGIWTPSFPAPARFPRRFTRALGALADHGFAVRLAPSTTADDGLLAAEPSQLAAELHSLLAEPEVNIVLAAVGGYTSLAVAPHLDFDFIAAHAKPIIGYSDLTSILWAVLARSSLVTFHGPMVVSEWGEAGGPLSFTTDNFTRVLAPWSGPIELMAPSAWTDELLWWDRDDTRPRETQAGTWRCVIPGTVEGPLLAGCLPTAGALIGTPYLPDLDGAVLCLETNEMSPERCYGLLVQWRESGLLNRIAGLVIGRHCRPRARGDGARDFDRVFLAALGSRRIPVLADVDFGHTQPMLTLPLGVTCRLDADERRLTLLTTAVVERRAGTR